MTDLDKEILLIYNRLQQISVIIESVFEFNHKIIKALEQNSELASKIHLKTTEVISKRITILEEIAAIITKLHQTEIGESKVNELVEKARQIDDEYNQLHDPRRQQRRGYGHCNYQRHRCK